MNLQWFAMLGAAVIAAFLVRRHIGFPTRMHALAMCADAAPRSSSVDQIGPAWMNSEQAVVTSIPAHRLARTPAERLQWAAARASLPPPLHPVVRTHPVSGRQGLFANEGVTTRTVELSATDSNVTQRQLFAHAAKPEFTARWRWKVGDLAFWDNRLTQHCATADGLPARRVMRRAAILGDVPCHQVANHA